MFPLPPSWGLELSSRHIDFPKWVVADSVGNPTMKWLIPRLRTHSGSHLETEIPVTMECLFHM